MKLCLPIGPPKWCRIRSLRGRALCWGAAVGIALGTWVSPALAQSMRLSDALLQRLAERYDDEALSRLREWQRLLVEHTTDEEAEKVNIANTFFNRIPWVSDSDLWGKRDYWASPVEMIGRNGGDCEDFSIAKFFTLKDLGVKERKLLITYVRARKLNQAHMVLAYYPRAGQEPLILDNLDSNIRLASRRRDLVPVYSFNGSGLWKGIQRSRGKRAGSAKRLAGWRTMLRRLNSDLTTNDG
jgi:predicted transglutaminase-like cysteine proteinase